MLFSRGFLSFYFTRNKTIPTQRHMHLAREFSPIYIYNPFLFPLSTLILHFPLFFVVVVVVVVFVSPSFRRSPPLIQIHQSTISTLKKRKEGRWEGGRDGGDGGRVIREK